jgi:glycine/D-amino acid oxidase-like deaminating enzyme
MDGQGKKGVSTRREFIQLSGVLGLSMALHPGGRSEPDHIVVVGGGIIGTSIAYHLAQRGARVLLCEKARPGSGATGNSFAWLNASFEKRPQPYYLLNLLGIAGWRRLQRELKDEVKVQWGGSIAWFPPGEEAQQLRADVRRHQAWGYATNLVDVKELQKLLPNIRPGPTDVASFSEHEGTMNPSQALEVLIRSAEQLGVKLLYPCEVTGFEVTSGRIRAVQTTRGCFPADVVVLAAGIDAPALGDKLGVPVLLNESPGLLAHTPSLPPVVGHIAHAPGVHIKQNPEGEIVMGTSFGASHIADANTNMDSASHILQRAANFVPSLEHASIARVTVGWRVLPRDGYPIIGFAPGCPNLYIASTHSGMTLSPLIGQLACLEILDKADVDILQPYRPARFSGSA